VFVTEAERTSETGVIDYTVYDTCATYQEIEARTAVWETRTRFEVGVEHIGKGQTHRITAKGTDGTEVTIDTTRKSRFVVVHFVHHDAGAYNYWDGRDIVERYRDAGWVASIVKGSEKEATVAKWINKTTSDRFSTRMRNIYTIVDVWGTTHSEAYQ